MALETNKGAEPMIEATEKLWLTADKNELVPDGDPRAAYLFCTPGRLVSREDAQRYGMSSATGDKPEDEQDDEPDSDEKQAQPAANKQRRRPSDK